MLSTIKTVKDMVVTKVYTKFTSKLSANEQLVVVAVLIAVAVGLCIIFRNHINDAITGLFNRISSVITGLNTGSVNSAGTVTQNH